MGEQEQQRRAEQRERIQQLVGIALSKKDDEAYSNLERRALGKIAILSVNSPMRGKVETLLKRLIDEDNDHKSRNFRFRFASRLDRYIAQIEYDCLSRNINFDFKSFDDKIQSSHDSALIKAYQKHGGVKYLTNLLTLGAGVANDVVGVMKSLRQMAQNRYMIKSIGSALGKIDINADSVDNIETALAEITRQMVELSSSEGDQPIRLSEAGQEWLDVFYNTRATNGKLIGLPTDFDELDSKIGGFRPGQMIVIGARPAVGKTAFSLELANRFASADTKKQLNGLYLSLEMNRLELYDRLIAHETLIDGQKIKKGEVSDYEWSKIMYTLEEGKISQWGEHLYVDENPSLTIDQIEERIQSVSQKVDHLDFIFVDYMQLIATTNENRQQAVANISRRLKIIAKKYQTTVFALSQLNRRSASDGRADKTTRPVLSDLRESGQIEQDADVVIMLSVDGLFEQQSEDSQNINGGNVRTNNTDEIVALEIVKNRSGERGLIYYDAQRPYSRFVELTQAEIDRIKNKAGNHDDRVINDTTSAFDKTVKQGMERQAEVAQETAPDGFSETLSASEEMNEPDELFGGDHIRLGNWGGDDE